MQGTGSVDTVALWASLNQQITPECPQFFHKCNNSECIQNFKMCDSKRDCTDGSDEINCDGKC